MAHKHQCALCPYSAKFLGSYKSHLATHSTERPFKCAECPFRTKWKQALKKHAQNVHLKGTRSFPCPHSGCSYAAKQKSNLTQHSKIHYDENFFSCSQPNCNYSTFRKDSLIFHTRTHTGEKPFVCQFESCSYAAGRRADVQKHSRIHTKERPFKCLQPNCEYSAALSGSLKGHQLTHSPKEGEERPSFPCPICKYKGKSQQCLSHHIKSHTLEKLFKCDEPSCKFEAKTKSDIQKHKVVHSDEKPFACSVESCEFRSKFQTSLNSHLKLHENERRYKCEQCPFRANSKVGVTSHLTLIHSDPDFRPFKCTEPKCDFATKTKSSLKSHLLIHKGEKNFVCSFPDCDYRAVSQRMVKTHHYNIHSDEKKGKCNICQFRCKTNTQLTRHVRIHTKETPYVCKENGCTFQAAQSGHLRQHAKRRHSHVLTCSKLRSERMKMKNCR